ncbi:hypothetical protein EVAR_16916_1 [Eumeta japonica]|uniref:Uncharacterized protein n=1 Tax=Eumeta variegata TaxID=151549 RepID=A0A4C1TVR0_EUMVA|nr:hypothetical protein EVAR_16916_1 [Eumeta japonica]
MKLATKPSQWRKTGTRRRRRKGWEGLNLRIASFADNTEYFRQRRAVSRARSFERQRPSTLTSTAEVGTGSGGGELSAVPSDVPRVTRKSNK